MEVLAEIPDLRKSRGKRYPLVAILALCCVAMLCGYRSPNAVAEWCDNYGDAYLKRLGFTKGSYRRVAGRHLLSGYAYAGAHV